MSLMSDNTRAEWLEARRGGVGGSDAAAVLGLDPWKSALEVYLEKTGQMPPSETNERMHWGNRLEAAIADEFSYRHGFELVEEPPLPVRRSNVWPWVMGNPDRFVLIPGEDDGILEIKSTDKWNADSWEDGPPDRVIVQLQHYLAVTGASRGWIAVLVGGNAYRDFTVDRDDELIAQMVELERVFWHRVADEDPPAPDASVSAKEALAILYRDADPESELELPDEARVPLAQLAQAKAMKKDAERDVLALENQAKAWLGEHTVGLLDGAPVIRWTPVTTERVGLGDLEADHPELVAKYRRPSTSRRFSLVKGKS